MVVVVSLYRIIILVERGVYFQCGIRVTESVIIEYVVICYLWWEQFIFFIIIVAGVAVSQYNIFRLMISFCRGARMVVSLGMEPNAKSRPRLPL